MIGKRRFFSEEDVRALREYVQTNNQKGKGAR
jgi:hypothetical protein